MTTYYLLPAFDECGRFSSLLPPSLIYPATAASVCAVLSQTFRDSLCIPFRNEIMELVSWTLNAIDQIFTTRRPGKGEPSCPQGTFAAGYIMDSWGDWRMICLSMLSLEDVEDVYIFGFMIIGFLLIGTGGYLLYRKVDKAMVIFNSANKLPVDGLCRAVNTQTNATCDINRRLDEQSRKIDKIMEKIDAIGEEGS